MERFELVIVGAGAAGLMAAIAAGRKRAGARVALLDGARSLGAKILVAGGGRCNVTHYQVSEKDFNGSTPPAIRKVLRGFPVEQTIAFFAELGVNLKREETGKLFPTTDRARTVLSALLDEVRRVGVSLRHPSRVESIRCGEDGFVIAGSWGELAARAVVIATGGKALPKSGSDGLGYRLVGELGVPVAEPIFPALVPLALEAGDRLTELSGLSTEVELSLSSATGKRLDRRTGSLLFTHKGLSGPIVLDVSRHWIEARRSDPGVTLSAAWLPDWDEARLNRWMLEHPRATPQTGPLRQLPSRLTRTLCELAGVAPGSPNHSLTKLQRKALVQQVARTKLHVVGDLGYTKAEVTAGGVPLKALRLPSMESRDCPGLFLCGEICDVDGRIGGFNFQWAWSSGWAAGRAAVR